jgi:tRNA modification GTPase
LSRWIYPGGPHGGHKARRSSDSVSISFSMPLDLEDTIVALASATGVGGRAIIRLSGSRAIEAAGTVFSSPDALCKTKGRLEGSFKLGSDIAPLPGCLLVWTAPNSYTAQDVVEIHALSSPPLVESMVQQLLNAGCRAAQSGEFTMRGFLAGKLDLTQAEAVLGVIEAGSRNELKHALGNLAGGVARPMQELRDDLLNLLADVEASLDFAEEDIHPSDQTDLLNRLSKGMAQVTLVRKQIDERGVVGEAFRVVLVGRPNAGKSSLFNVLANANALVSPTPGTTRDYLARSVRLERLNIELVDTAGWLASDNTIDRQAQRLALGQIKSADLLLVCTDVSAGTAVGALPPLFGSTAAKIIPIATKCDLAAAPSGVLATSAVTGLGIEALRGVLAEEARVHRRPALAPSLSRCRHHADALLIRLQQAHAAALYGEPPEVLAAEVRAALDELGAMVGTVYTDDLLDRIFSRFCIGK